MSARDQLATVPDPLAVVRAYHDQTKHHYNRFARSLGYLDWAAQPAPFRAFAGCRRIDLVEPFREAASARHAVGVAARALGAAAPTRRAAATLLDVGYDDLFVPCTTPRSAPGLLAVSVFLRFSLGLSAWKQAGPSRWALRVNPSSGNLHPTEGYVVCGPGVIGAQAGVYHYLPDAHALEERCVFDGAASAASASALPEGSFLAGLTSIHWREAWKYGERAFRYCQHDIGHAVAAMRMASALLGWTCAVLPGWPARSIAALLGLDREPDFRGAEPEEPACMMIAAPPGTPSDVSAGHGAARIGAELVEAARRGSWSGRASRLSSDRVQWDWIDAVAEASREGEPGAVEGQVAPLFPAQARDARTPTGGGGGRDADARAASLLLRRRSAVEMDGTTSISLDRFTGLLRRLLPAAGPPFDALPWTPRLHLVLFVHRVEGLQPGLYALPRTSVGDAVLRSTLRPAFAWTKPPDVPLDLPLFLLDAADCRRIARELSCGQDIAADGCFSLGMLAEFDAALADGGPASYRRLFWEAGAIGQALYLEAEAAGVRGTGIGCFFDDAVHELLGVADHRVQSLYHFTVGGPVDDPRLTTHPGYAWE